VYSRQIDGRTLTLAPSGWTYKRTFVLYDKETGSLWYPGEKGLKGIQGFYFNRRLPEVESERTSWRDWRRHHPATKLMK
jgi:hypothetical protein